MTTPPPMGSFKPLSLPGRPGTCGGHRSRQESIQAATQAFRNRILPLLDPTTSPEALNQVLNKYVENANALELKAGKIFAFFGEQLISTDS